MITNIILSTRFTIVLLFASNPWMLYLHHCVICIKKMINDINKYLCEKVALFVKKRWCKCSDKFDATDSLTSAIVQGNVRSIFTPLPPLLVDRFQDLTLSSCWLMSTFDSRARERIPPRWMIEGRGKGNIG